MTKQGIAIQQAAVDFGDGKTLPFCPCKRGYKPFNDETRQPMVACSFHETARRKRLTRDRGKLRGGEADPKALFWDKQYCSTDDDSKNKRLAIQKATSKAQQQRVISKRIKMTDCNPDT